MLFLQKVLARVAENLILLRKSKKKNQAKK